MRCYYEAVFRIASIAFDTRKNWRGNRGIPRRAAVPQARRSSLSHESQRDCRVYISNAATFFQVFVRQSRSSRFYAKDTDIFHNQGSSQFLIFSLHIFGSGMLRIPETLYPFYIHGIESARLEYASESALAGRSTVVTAAVLLLVYRRSKYRTRRNISRNNSHN